jgi:lysophospholipase L1-like esterase
MKRWLLLAVCGVWAICSAAPAAEQKLQAGDLVAICGDSITEQKIYSVDIEDYLVMCKPVPAVRAEQFGWSGETSWGFLDKMAIFTLPFKPAVATTCYGMNDGGYGPRTEERATHYREAQTAVIEKLKQSGVHFIVLGSPGAVDSDTFHRSPDQAAIYNNTLGALRDIDREIAQNEGVAFADVHQAMMTVMAKAKAKYGNAYPFAGDDGVHPGPNGHLVMAYALLKALGADGNIGTISVDLAAKKAQASDGHKIVSFDGSAVTIESARYPFCFYGDANGISTRGIVDLLPFNDELNRFMLIITNPGADRVKVIWGEQSKEFSAADLAKGINLAAEFIDDNPFRKPFADVEQAIRAKQAQETNLIKNLYFPLNQQAPALSDVSDAIAKIDAAIDTKIAAAATQDRDAAQPVTHTITIEPVK